MTERTLEILLVEDNPSDLELTLYALNEHRVANRIQVARDGVEALEYIFCNGAHARRAIESGPDLILLDLKLPRVDGIEVLRLIKSDPRTRTIPVVMLTASREERDIVECYGLGVNSYIVKPVDFVQFTEAMRTVGIYWLLINEPAVRKAAA